MSKNKEIYDFAIKWRDKIADPEVNFLELNDHYMGDDCRAVGFEMDCGEAFGQKYGKAAYDSEALKKIIEVVTDIPLLGSAVFSMWRYFNHWSYTGAEILEPQNREWFVTALNRLAFLAEKAERDHFIKKNNLSGFKYAGTLNGWEYYEEDDLNDDEETGVPRFIKEREAVCELCNADEALEAIGKLF